MRLRDYLKDCIPPKQIDGFFDKSICMECIIMAEQGSWKDSNYGSRKIQTTDLDQDWLTEKIRDHAPARILDWEYAGYHRPTCQFFKYTVNDTFPDHQDQPIHVAADVQSLFTLVVYLNDCRGGSTGFPELEFSIDPQLGKAVLFPQNLLHNSARIESGLKYILRAQILYRNRGSYEY